MTDPVPADVRILAGAPAAAHTRVARPGSSNRWFEPMHVREPAMVREQMVDQVVAGATILLAPTWLTHRRALVPVGETRRAQGWTSRAVGVAREASDIGGERRGGGPAITILGVLPDPDAIDEAATGRLLKPDAAAERDERVQAGILAEAGVGGVLIEARPSLDRARVAVRSVIEQGLTAWIAIPGSRADGLALGAWVDALAADGAAMLLFESLDRASGESPSDGPFGILASGPLSGRDPEAWTAQATAGIEHGASVLGIAADATPETLRPLVVARDTFVAATASEALAAQSRFDIWMGDVTARAAGGRALWLGDAPARLPERFDWTVEPRDLIGMLPAGAWRLVVCRETLDPRDAVRLVERGGIVAGAWDDPAALPAIARASGLRLDDVSRTTIGEWRYISRRED